MALTVVLRARMEEASREEAEELAFEEGTLSSASCSSEIDRKRILAAIVGKEVLVERALRGLMCQGLSTIEMRRATLTWTSGNVGYVDISRTITTSCIYVGFVLFWIFLSYHLTCGTISGRLCLFLLSRISGSLIPAVVVYSSAFCSPARELAAWMVDATFQAALFMALLVTIEFVVLLLCMPPSAHYLLMFAMDETILCTAVLAYRRNRHIRRSVLQGFCTKWLFAGTFLGFVETSLSITIAEGLSLFTWMFWLCTFAVILAWIAAWRCARLGRGSTGAMISTIAYFIHLFSKNILTIRIFEHKDNLIGIGFCTYGARKFRNVEDALYPIQSIHWLAFVAFLVCEELSHRRRVWARANESLVEMEMARLPALLDEAG